MLAVILVSDFCTGIYFRVAVDLFLSVCVCVCFISTCVSFRHGMYPVKVALPCALLVVGASLSSPGLLTAAKSCQLCHRPSSGTVHW